MADLSPSATALLQSIRAGYKNNLISILDIDSSLYDIHDFAVDELAKYVADSNDAFDSRITTLENQTLPNVSDTAVENQFVVAVSESNGAISVSRSGINAGQVQATKDSSNDITVQAWLTSLQNAISSLSGIDTDTLAEIQKIIDELEGTDPNDPAKVWSTLVDKLKGLTIGNTDATVKQYVLAYVNAIDNYLNSNFDLIKGNLNSLSFNDTILAGDAHTHTTISIKEYDIEYVNNAQNPYTLKFTSTTKNAASVPGPTQSPVHTLSINGIGGNIPAPTGIPSGI